MFLSTNKCEGIGECINICPTEAIRLINGRAFSCITCGACFDACPNQAIFKNRYEGYVVDRAKCNGCGVCEFTCPVDSIHIEDGIVKGICARCGICVEACPTNSRLDGFDLIENKQIDFLKSFNLAIPNLKQTIPAKIEVKRNCVGTSIDECILCGRCDYYCPTNAINVNIDQNGICTKCRVCSDVCPADAITDQVVDHDKCVLCLNCLKNCPNDAIILEDFKVNIVKSDEEISGSIISCLNCGLCADNNVSGALKQIDGKMRYDPSVDIFNGFSDLEDDEKLLKTDTDKGDMKLAQDLLSVENESPTLNQKSIENCPVSTLKEDINEGLGLIGYCVSCGRCVKVCDKQYARQFESVKWDGKVSDDCISCGICSELCPKDAITLKRGDIHVDLDKCILCETCGIHCPTDAIPKTTMAKKSIASGFNLIDNKLCMNCKLCYRICPESAIIDREDINMMMVDENKCIYCGACVNACPAKAFIFEREFKNSIND
ncbi:tetrathionate reductase subunit B precursor [Methanobrevibacter cuticularis]|uniref:Tetrathionate reductase subunit B n=1 Tax=Methanobrevibacter cuticularis TaxID=47311 RepID=A0A166DJU2_9EURY|nr:4Fe-4S binding protein [Methanobrevibacter cuticularis]KZX15672.1 tetrathionate reductase subunit B precursor [Methanobrevibacter cuticularis]